MYKQRYHQSISAALVPFIAAGFACFGATPDTGAEVLISQDFQEPLDGLPGNWEVNEDGGVSRGIQSWGDDGAPDYGLQFRRDEGGLLRSNAYYTGDTVFDDFHGSMTMGVSGTQTFVGALLRLQSHDRTDTTGYWAGILNRNTLAITLDPGGRHQDAGTVLESVDIGSVTQAVVRLEFSAVGDTLSAEAYVWDTDDGDWSHLGSVTTTDDTYADGRFGVRASFAAEPREAFVADLTVTRETVETPDPLTVEILPREEGQFRFRVAGEPDQDIVIEASEDLSEWNEIATGSTGESGVLDFADPESHDHERRFYRARSE